MLAGISLAYTGPTRAPCLFTVTGGYPLEIIDMALVDMKIGKRRRKHIEFVVVGEEGPGMRLGDIRWIEWDRSKTSPILRVEYDSKERSRVINIEVSPAYRRRGWKLLRDMFEEDPEAAQYWDDYKRFADAQAEDPEGMKGKDFPEHMLPAALVEMRNTAKVSKADRTDFVFSDGSRLSEHGSKKAAPKKAAPKKATATKEA